MSAIRGIQFVAVALATFVCISTAHARDIYIGTLAVQAGKLVLKRCDLAQNTYTLLDEKNDGRGIVARFVKAHAKGAKSNTWYAEVIGDYQEHGGKDALEVLALENIQAGKNCHLRTLIENVQK